MSKLTRLVRHLAVALVASLGLNAWAANPIAVWDGDFTELTKGDVTIDVNGNTTGAGYLEIADTASNGILFTHSNDSGLQNFTVVMRCSGIDLASTTNQVLFTTCAGDADDVSNMTGVYLPPSNALVRGIWKGSDWMDGATQGCIPSDYTTLVYNHQRTNGAYAYAISDDAVTTLFSVVGLRSSGSNYKGFAVGGLRKVTKDFFKPAVGLKITKVAVFNQTITTDEMKAYAFPSEMTAYVYDGETPVWTPSTPADVKPSDTITINAEGATLACDAPCKVVVATGASLTTEGDITVGNDQTVISGALNVNSGTLTLTTKSNGGLDNNVVTIAKGATFKSANNDMPYWDGDNRSTTIKVYGTLDFSNTRWTFAAGEKVIAYAGAEIKGAGDGQGAIDPNGNTGVVLDVSGTEGEVTCSAPIRARSAAQILVADGMTLNYSGTLGDGVGSNGNVLTKDGAGTMKITTNFNTTGGLKIAAGKVVVTDAVLRGGVQVLAGAALELNSASTMDMPTIKDGTEGSVTIASGIINVGTQRKAIVLNESAAIKATATLAEFAAGSLTISGAKSDQVTVVDQNGNTIVVTSVSADGVISLQTNAPITTSCNLSQMIAGKTGTIVVQGAIGEAESIVVTVDCAIPEGLQLTVTGKADFAFDDGSEVSAGTIKLESGSVATVSGTINNTITLSDGATIITSGEVTFGEGKQILRTANNKNATLTISSGSTMTLAAANSINTAVTINVYGTLDLGGITIDFKSNPAEATYNLYVGATIANGQINHQGGYNLGVSVLDCDSEDKVVHFNSRLQTAGWNYVPAIFTTAEGTSVEFGQTFGGGAPVVIRGTTKDVEIKNGGRYDVSAARSLKGNIIVGAGTTLNVTVGDAFEYENNKANLDVYGTINVNANRQTLSSSNQSYGAGAIKLHNGAQIIGAGASHNNFTKGLDIWNATTIEVDGTVTISTPLYGEAARSTVSFVKAADAETAVVNMTSLNALNGGLVVGDGVVVDCGAEKATKYAVTLQGGTLKGEGAGNAHGNLIKSVTLTKDSRIESTTKGKQIGIGVAGSADTTIDLAGHTLTMAAAQASDRIYLDKTSITSAGTLVIEQGILFVHCKHLGTVEGVNLVIGENASVQIAGDANFEGERTIEVATLTYDGTLPTQEHPKFVVSGTVSGKGNLAQLDIAEGATIDVTNGSLTVASSLWFHNSINVVGATAGDTVITKTGGYGETLPAVTLDGATGYELVNENGTLKVAKASTGPTSWDDVEDVTTVLPEGTTTTVTADQIKAWASDNGVTFEAGIKVPVNALIFNTTPAAVQAETFVAEDAAGEILKDYLEEATKDVDLATLLKAIPKEGKEITVEGYPMATIKLVPATLGADVKTSAELFKLSIELK